MKNLKGPANRKIRSLLRRSGVPRHLLTQWQQTLMTKLQHAGFCVTPQLPSLAQIDTFAVARFSKRHNLVVPRSTAVALA